MKSTVMVKVVAMVVVLASGSGEVRGWNPDQVKQINSQIAAGQTIAAPGYDLSGLNFQQQVSNWSYSLRYADLSWSNLTGAVLDGADLEGTKFAGAVLTGASLANISGRNLYKGSVVNKTAGSRRIQFVTGQVVTGPVYVIAAKTTLPVYWFDSSNAQFNDINIQGVTMVVKLRPIKSGGTCIINK
jgi:uncharacterized protein YjbI with pentapeptide repeats